MLPACPQPLRISMEILGLLWFHINFWIACVISIKNVMGILTGMTLICRLLWVVPIF